MRAAKQTPESPTSTARPSLCAAPGSESDVAKFLLPMPLKHCASVFRLMVRMHSKGLRMKQEGQWLIMYIPNTELRHGGENPMIQSTPETVERPASPPSAQLIGSGRYGVIYADPPWRYDNGTPGREIERHYPTMIDEEICALEVPAAKDAILYLWATAPRLESGLLVMAAWGFRYKTQAVWDKVKVGMGFWFRGQHEILMVGTRGDVSPPPQAMRIPSVIRNPRGQHSSKPDYVRDMIAKWYPDAKRLEMFSRLKRPGWDVFGNQVECDLLSGTQLYGHNTELTDRRGAGSVK